MTEYAASDASFIRPIDLFDREVATPSRGESLSIDELTRLASDELGDGVSVRDAPAMLLSARRPHDDGGFLDMFKPTRWDSTSDLIYMSADYDNNFSRGYVRFTTAGGGQFLVSIRLSGHQTTLRVSGPWGLVSAFSATTSDHPTATALWTGAAGASLDFSFSFSGGIIGYIEQIAVHALD